MDDQEYRQEIDRITQERDEARDDLAASVEPLEEGRALVLVDLG